MSTLPLRFTRPTAEMPTRAHPTDAGLDLYAAHTVDVIGDDIHTIGTGVAVAIPEGHVGLLFGRSSLATTYGVQLANSVGVIDSGYRGEIKVAVHKIGRAMKRINQGERIAQLVIVPCVIPTLDVVPTLPETVRGAGGFGSTGVR